MCHGKIGKVMMGLVVAAASLLWMLPQNIAPPPENHYLNGLESFHGQHRPIPRASTVKAETTTKATVPTKDVVIDSTTTTQSADSPLLPHHQLPFSTDPIPLKTIESILQLHLPQKDSRPLGSDVIELRHCNLDYLQMHNFTVWAQHVLQSFQSNLVYRVDKHDKDVEDVPDPPRTYREILVPELTLMLLEMWASHQLMPGTDTANGEPTFICDWNRYPLAIPTPTKEATRILQSVPVTPPTTTTALARLCIVIVAYRDIDHLHRIVESLHMDHHMFVIHLERTTSPDYAAQVHTLAAQYHNIAVVQFGSVVYRSDLVSHINYQIMHWLEQQDPPLHYDYLLTLGGAVYPLLGPHELARHLAQQRDDHNRHVWLGELLHNGQSVAGLNSQYGSIERKRLYSTAAAGKFKMKLSRRAVNTLGFQPTLPSILTDHIRYKANSGNQAVFSKRFIQDLVASSAVRQLFALSKYGCCCCIEERTWIGVAHLLGYGAEAMQYGSMFQTWGGDEECHATMHNAVLTVDQVTNETATDLCYRYEDGTKGGAGAVEGGAIQDEKRGRGDHGVYIRGDDALMATLKDAKARGFLFARKFRSDHAGSMALLQRIRQELHETE